MVEYRWVILREYFLKGLSGFRVRVIVIEMLIGFEFFRVCGDWVDILVGSLVIVFFGVVVLFVRCFNVLFFDIYKFKLLNRSRKVF